MLSFIVDLQKCLLYLSNSPPYLIHHFVPPGVAYTTELSLIVGHVRGGGLPAPPPPRYSPKPTFSNIMFDVFYICFGTIANSVEKRGTTGLFSNLAAFRRPKTILLSL